MKCQHCKKYFKESDIQVHHLHPKFMDNKKGSGMKLNLCRDCHMRLHLEIPKYYWCLLNDWQKMEAVELVEKISKKYGNIK